MHSLQLPVALLSLFLTEGVSFTAADTVAVSSHRQIIVKVAFTPDYQSPDPVTDTIYYSPERPLRWADFSGKPDKTSSDAAVCYSSFGYTGSAFQRGDTVFVRITLQVFFVKSASWVMPGMGDDYSLAHEQLHFDITKLSADHYRKSVLTTVMHPDDYDSYLQYLFLDAFRYMNHLQDRYDHETRHGMDHAEQAKWREQVKAELQEHQMQAD